MFFKKKIIRSISPEERKDYTYSIIEGCNLSRKSLDLLKNPERADCLINKLKDPSKDNISFVLITLDLFDSEENRKYLIAIRDKLKKQYG